MADKVTANSKLLSSLEGEDLGTKMEILESRIRKAEEEDGDTVELIKERRKLRKAAKLKRLQRELQEIEDGDSDMYW